jgi:hypothetical protein
MFSLDGLLITVLESSVPESSDRIDTLLDKNRHFSTMGQVMGKDTEGEETRTYDKDWDDKVKVLTRLAYGESMKYAARGTNFSDRQVRYIKERAPYSPPWLMKKLPEEVQDYLKSIKEKLEAKRRKQEAIQEESQFDKEDLFLILRREEHWDQLAELIGILIDAWNPDWHDSNLDSKGEFIFSEADEEETNWTVAEGLAVHLKADFKEFKNIKRFKDLLGASLIKDSLEPLYVLQEVSDGHRFRSKCPICKYY